MFWANAYLFISSQKGVTNLQMDVPLYAGRPPARKAYASVRGLNSKKLCSFRSGTSYPEFGISHQASQVYIPLMGFVNIRKGRIFWTAGIVGIIIVYLFHLHL